MPSNQLSPALQAAISRLVDYNWAAEERDYEECGPWPGQNSRHGHIYEDLVLVRYCLNGRHVPVRFSAGRAGHPAIAGPPHPGHKDSAAISPCVLVISHRHGDDVTLHLDQAAARQALAEFARAWWDEIATRVDGPPPPDDNEAIRVYFDHQAAERYTISEVDLPPGWPSAGGDGAPADDACSHDPAAPSPTPRDISDNEALSRVCYLLRDPDWGSGMLEDIRDLVDRTGRNCASYADERATWGRH